MINATRFHRAIFAICALSGLGALILAARLAWEGLDPGIAGLRTELAGLLFGAVVLLCVSVVALIVSVRRSERDRDNSEARQRRLLDFQKQVLDAHTITFSWDNDARFTAVNENFERCFGFPEADILGKPVSILYAHRHLDEDFLEIARAMAGGRVWSGDQRMRNRSGGTVFVEMTAGTDTDEKGRRHGGTAMLTDVTALRQAESDHFLTAMLEELQDEVFVFDTESLDVHYMNKAARTRCGWSVEEVREHRITDTDPAFSEKAMRTHTQPLLDGTKSMVSISVENAKGPTEITTYLFESANGRPLFVAVLRDISDQRALENARMQSVSVVSHELRAPLTSIKGSLRLLQSGVMGSLPQEANAVVDIACRNSDRLLMVVNDILDLDKIQSGKMDFEMSDIDLRTLIQDAMEMNQGYADEHGVSVIQELPEAGDLRVRGNADRLMQVMTNLMTNAIKFSPEDGSVRITAERTADKWRVTVIDTGPGIPESSRKYLGQPFAQLASVDGRKRVGTGLGLTIVKSIIQRHDGRFGVESVVGEGSQFYFEIPASAPLEIEENGDTNFAAAG